LTKEATKFEEENQTPTACSPEAALIERICNGERELFHELVRPHQRSIYLIAYSILQNEADAEDVAQEAILKAFRYLDKFRGDSKFSTWLTRIAINEARMRVRKAHSALFEPLDEDERNEQGEYIPQDFSDWHELPSEILERKEVRALLAKAMAALPQMYREVLVLRDVRQFSIAETAQTLGIREGSVKTRLLRARLQMRDLIAPEISHLAPRRRFFMKGKKPWS
jgi:RNA polymerase sigma-70 factor (ECF subfamily)